VFGILARDLVARNGRDDDYIILIDNNGCPTDPSIFPSLEKVPETKALQGKFDAFKFSDDVVVRFQVNVQFCLQECDPVSCGDSSSYGRRRRRRTEESPFPILPDYPLQREIIVEGISVTRIKDDDVTKDTGNNGENEICTSKTVVAAAVISAVLVQLCIIIACITCLVLNRRSHDRDDVSTTTSHMTPFGSRGILQSLRRLE
ncbi:uncharacterized protein LOC106477689, partial [Limulus polyphemus]|uniref:Uncharacterized protein LOC106477689 n=1 Tax=Limulus polyphemus TaxID=6850 RepID=A0ABM1C3U7_LIMPO